MLSRRKDEKKRKIKKKEKKFLAEGKVKEEKTNEEGKEK